MNYNIIDNHNRNNNENKDNDALGLIIHSNNNNIEDNSGNIGVNENINSQQQPITSQEDPQNIYVIQASILNTMGYFDNNLNQLALESVNGNVNDAIDFIESLR